MKVNPNEPVQPIYDTLRHVVDSNGLTKREYFTAAALQGILAREDSPYRSKDKFLKSITSISVELADQLIIELNKTN